LKTTGLQFHQHRLDLSNIIINLRRSVLRERAKSSKASQEALEFGNVFVVPVLLRGVAWLPIHGP
jgi:hypothetical protein